MFCPSCGTENKDGSKFCWKCGVFLAEAAPPSAGVSLEKKSPVLQLNESADFSAPRTAAPAASATLAAVPASRPAGYTLPAPDNFLVQAILVTLCCCLPFGIASIVYASQVNSKVAAGDMAGAHESARKARFWFWWALGLGLPIQILLVFIQVAAGLAGS
ncbi:MAG: CD225/dispanin family protein [Brachymonas sp.]|jgi:hypothetical protein